MATKTLTQNSPTSAPNVGEFPAKCYLGWQMSTANAQDFVLAINTIVGAMNWVGTARAAIDPSSAPDADGFTNPTWTVTLQKGAVTLNCVAGQWVAFDGVTPVILDDADVQANYTVANYTP